MLYIKGRTTRSWLTKYGYILAAKLANRLVERCKGEKGVKLELTYERSQFEGPQDLYHTAKQKRHVGRFMHKLGRWMGESLSGRWLCKMEFQKGGYLHWHIILLGVTYIPHDVLTRLWSHGHAWVSRITKRRLQYVCKYVAKADGVPAFLYLEPMRSVKIIRASPGFWGDVEDPSDELEEEPDELPPNAEIREPPTELKLKGSYISIGQAIDRQQCKTVVRDDHGRFGNVDLDPWQVVEYVRRCGGKIVTAENGWLAVRDFTWDKVWALASAVSQERGRAAAPEAARSRSAASRSDAIHLIHGGNPTRQVIPTWLRDFFLETYGMGV